MRGISVSKGYHSLPRPRLRPFVDGWLKSGDLASIDDRGHLRITGRKKELIVTAGGKNVSPRSSKSPSRRTCSSRTSSSSVTTSPYIGALIALDTEMLPEWLATHGLPSWTRGAGGEPAGVRDSLERRSPAPTRRCRARVDPPLPHRQRCFHRRERLHDTLPQAQAPPRPGRLRRRGRRPVRVRRGREDQKNQE